ncbi:MAG: 6-bladed beta-propeller [Parabacteroides sp.]|nr:6-bladed beta-propeller [Parabacteroides sp.]
MTLIHNIYIIIYLFVCVCPFINTLIAEASPKTINNTQLISLSSGSKVNDVQLTEIVDTLFYTALDYPKIKTILQVHLHDSLILINDSKSVIIFNRQGKYLRSIPLEKGSMDIVGDILYTYQFLNKEICAYTLKGDKLWRNLLNYPNEAGYMGDYFVSITPNLFAVANMSIGYNHYELLFFNKEGEIVNSRENRCFFQKQQVNTYNSIWKRLLFRGYDGIYYHPFFNDTVYSVQYTNIRPAIIEKLVKKVPLKQRLEYTGESLESFHKYCLKENVYATRFFETERYIIVEYQIGSLLNSVSNYFIYDKTTQKLSGTHNDLLSLLNNSQRLHIGIFNDYDGGLAFQPMHQTENYLIMVDAGDNQGVKKSMPSELYRKGRKIKDKSYICTSDVWLKQKYKDTATSFFDKNKGDNSTILTIVKLKK